MSQPHPTQWLPIPRFIAWVGICKGVFKDSETESQTFSGPSELVAALRTHPARTLQQLHKEPQSIEKDALILNTVEEFLGAVSLCVYIIDKNSSGSLSSPDRTTTYGKDNPIISLKAATQHLWSETVLSIHIPILVGRRKTP